MMLTDTNGLCKMIHKDIDACASVYLDGDKVSVYTTFSDTNFLRLKIADYVGGNALQDSYNRLMIVSG